MHLRALTSLRFFAALMVVFHHMDFLKKSEAAELGFWYEKLFYEGTIGVTFFFILSGFILSYSYGEKLVTQSVDYTDYMFGRVARIFPLHLLTLLAALPLSLAGAILNPTKLPSTLLALAANATLIQAWIPSEAVYFSFNGPAWSISVEMFFYALFPLLLLLRSQTLLGLIVLVALFQHAIPWESSGFSLHFVAYVFPPSRLADFVTGILLCRLYRQRPIVSSTVATIAQAAALLLILIFLSMKESVPTAARFDLYYLAPMSFIILTFAWANGYLSRMISSRYLVLLGESSFALYLVHQIVIRYGEKIRISLNLHSALTDVAAVAAYMIISLVLSVVIHRLYENSARIRLLSALRRWRSARISTAEALR